jgi:hypothetical protein
LPSNGCVKKVAISAYQRVWRKKNHAKVAGYQRTWVKKNPAKVAKYSRKWRNKLTGGWAGYQLAWAQRNPGKNAEYQRKWRSRNRPARFLSAAQQRAKRKGRSCTLTLRWVERKLAAGKCEFTGLPFNMNASRNAAFSPSIHRIDNAKGYSASNCVMILNALNIGIGAWGLETAKAIWSLV